MSVSDLFIKDEGIGEVTARLTIRDNTLGVELDAASPRLIVSGTGRISMTDEYDAELTFRFTDTSLDPVRADVPAGAVAVYDGRGQRHAARHRRAQQPAAPSRGRARRRA